MPSRPRDTVIYRSFHFQTLKTKMRPRRYKNVSDRNYTSLVFCYCLLLFTFGIGIRKTTTDVVFWTFSSTVSVSYSLISHANRTDTVRPKCTNNCLVISWQACVQGINIYIPWPNRSRRRTWDFLESKSSTVPVAYHCALYVQACRLTCMHSAL